jgi:hypothetical protein
MTAAKTQARLLAGKAPIVDRYAGCECAVEGCTRPCRALSRYCSNHAKQNYRTRSPNGRIPRRRELSPYRERAKFALAAYGLQDHPAIAAARETLERMIANPGAIPQRYAKHWRRLAEGGATGEAMLLNILTVYGWRYVGLPDVHADDALFFCVLGSRFLRTVSVGWYTTAGGKLEQVRLPGIECETVGRALAEKVGALAILFWRRVERDDKERAQQALSVREALEKHPL